MATMVRDVPVKTSGFASLREYMAALEQRNLLKRVKVRVEKDGELGAVCRENFDREGPALLFEKVGDYKTPLLVGTLSTREQYALAMGVPPSTEAIAAKWREAYAKPIRRTVVSRAEAPCKEVVIDNPDLFADPFPVPKWHPHDGGPKVGNAFAGEGGDGDA